LCRPAESRRKRGELGAGPRDSMSPASALKAILSERIVNCGESNLAALLSNNSYAIFDYSKGDYRDDAEGSWAGYSWASSFSSWLATSRSGTSRLAAGNSTR